MKQIDAGADHQAGWLAWSDWLAGSSWLVRQAWPLETIARDALEAIHHRLAQRSRGLAWRAPRFRSAHLDQATQSNSL